MAASIRKGSMQVWRSPRWRGTYGIAATPDGEVWFCSLAGSYIARLDRATGKAELVEPPTERQGARRVWLDSRGRIWGSEWNPGQLSRHDPKSGGWKKWKMPGSDPRAYAVYVDEKDKVWVSDFGANVTLSLDPETETFTPFVGSGPDAQARQILGRPGEGWLPESGLDRPMVIRTGR